ncbi:ATP-binding cassette domain-containing protein [Vibrio lentus]|uniref:ATP-binding cassette domain-containing protein n=1 Tax=Vibrio lentus TaxID=136468 RepID=A0A4U2EF29_9VIBR|nr:ATP-binding cassette domain-containing protein [Vibrio lentus]
MVICGPSGSGKSTLIRCINQLEQALPSKFSTSSSSNQKSTAFWELGDPKISW